jgi:hypothetical protein
MPNPNTLVKVIAAFTPALTVASVTFIASKITDKFGNDLNPTEIKASMDEIKVTFSEKPKNMVDDVTQNTVPIDKYETAVNNAIRMVVDETTKPSIHGAKWSVSEVRIRMLY